MYIGIHILQLFLHRIFIRFDRYPHSSLILVGLATTTFVFLAYVSLLCAVHFNTHKRYHFRVQYEIGRDITYGRSPDWLIY